MYNLSDYGSMIADQIRMAPYAQALKETVKPDSVVLDIGAAAGIHALLACQYGARKVYAIEPNDAVHLAQQMAQANGYGDRIEFIQNISTRVTLPEPVDIIVSDLRGVLPLFGYHIPSLADARQRLLAPDGILIPKRDTLWVAPVEAPNAYADFVNPWDHPFDLDMEAAKQIVLNTWNDNNTDSIKAKNLLAPPQVWTVLDYTTIENPDVGCSDINQQATRDGIVHGLLIWFDAEIADGIGFSNGPQEKKAAEVYGRGFFPLLHPVPVAKGDTFNLAIHVDLIDGQYIWRWETQISEQGDPNAIKANFKQSTFDSASLNVKQLQKRVPDFQPALSEDGQIDQFILSKMNGRSSLEKIARQVHKRYRSHFKTEQESLSHVCNLSQQYSR